MRKQILCFLTAMCMIFSFCACSLNSGKTTEDVVFYYVRNGFQYHSETGVIVPEYRSASGNKDDINYLLSLYLMGPLDDTMKSPFPVQTRLLRFHSDANDISITLTEDPLSLSESQYSLGIACIALTCFETSNANIVTVSCGEKMLSVSRENLLLQDIAAIE